MIRATLPNLITSPISRQATDKLPMMPLEEPTNYTHKPDIASVDLLRSLL